MKEIGDIEVLGVGSGFAYEQGNTSFLIWDKEKTSALLLDCGNMVHPTLQMMEKIQNRKIIDKVDTVFISHSHTDHSGSLGNFILQRLFFFNQKTNLIGARVDEYAGLYFTPAEKEAGLRFGHAGEWNIHQIRVNHNKFGEELGCLVDGKILYSGDTGNSLLNTPEAKTATMIIHDVALFPAALLGDTSETPHNVHALFKDLLKNSTPETRAKSWFTHYSPAQYDQLSELATQHGFAGVLKQGMVFDENQQLRRQENKEFNVFSKMMENFRN